MSRHPERLRLVVLFGGQSAEHEVSCTTAAHVLRAVDRDRYDVVPVGITREGAWMRNDDARAALARGAWALPHQLEAAGTAIAPQAALAGAAGGGGQDRGADLEPTEQDLPGGEARVAGDSPVVVLPLLHGPYGEDGTVQGLLELAGVPYVGAGVLASALCMDKVKAKEVLAGHGLPIVRYLALHDSEATGGTDAPAAAVADAGLPYPVFVKPANLGSSVGVTKAHQPSELPAAVELALGYDEWVLIEEAVAGREIEVAVLGNAEPRTSVPGEIVPSHEFYDYEDKYLDGTVQLLVPAPLDEDEAVTVRGLAVDAYRALRCEGMARADFFYEAGGRGFIVNELNTIPGFTPVSMYPKLWEATGLPYPDLIDELVRLAVERHERRARFSTKR